MPEWISTHAASVLASLFALGWAFDRIAQWIALLRATPQKDQNGQRIYPKDVLEKVLEVREDLHAIERAIATAFGRFQEHDDRHHAIEAEAHARLETAIRALKEK